MIAIVSFQGFSVLCAIGVAVIKAGQWLQISTLTRQ
jgi:hypothetical protein